MYNFWLCNSDSAISLSQGHIQKSPNIKTRYTSAADPYNLLILNLSPPPLPAIPTILDHQSQPGHCKVSRRSMNLTSRVTTDKASEIKYTAINCISVAASHLNSI
jgi:hypothetical protein